MRKAVLEAALQKPAFAVEDSAQQPASAEHYFTLVSPIQGNANRNKELAHVAINSNQPATSGGKGVVHPFIPSQNGDKNVEERNGYSRDLSSNLLRGGSLLHFWLILMK